MFSRVARDKAALFVGVSSAALLSFDPAMAQTAGFQPRMSWWFMEQS